jgi:2-octaprenyl-6-methoxyphenol hydroxylase
MQNQKNNITMIGAGLTGLAFCNLLRDENIKVSLIDINSKIFYKTTDDMDRYIVLSNTSKIIFENIGIWGKIFKYCTKVKDIHISKKNIFGSTLVKSSDEDLESLGYQLPVKELIKILYENIENKKNIEFIHEAEVIKLNKSKDLEIKYVKNKIEKNITSNSVIFSTGATDNLVDSIFSEKVQKNYKQNALTCEIITDKYNSETAFERFTDRGIIGIIPRNSNSWTLIYSTDEDESEVIIKLKFPEAKEYFQNLIGNKCGKILDLKNIKKYPLKLKYYKDFTSENICLLGDAAHTLHPIAAQSFNLSLRDCAYLTDMIENSNTLEKNDFLLIFNNYNKSRIKEVTRLVKFTDFLASFVHGNGFLRNNIIGLSFVLMDMNKNLRVNAIRYLLGVNFSQSLIFTLKD